MKGIFIGVVAALSLNGAYAFEAGDYFSKNCTACHSIGGGDKIGPDLAGLSKRRDLDWIVKFVNYPSGMMEGDAEEPGYEKADPIAKKLYAAYKPMTMTEFELDKAKVEAIVKYIDSQNKKPKGKILNIKK